MKVLKVVVLVFLSLLLIYVVAGFHILPVVLKSQIRSAGATYTQGSIEVSAIRSNPFTLRLEVEGLEGLDANGARVFGVGLILLDLSWESLWSGAVILEEVRLNSPSTEITRRGDGQINITEYLEPSLSRAGYAEEGEPEQDTQDPEDSRPFPLIVRSFQVLHGAVAYRDNSLEEPYSVDLSPIDFRLRDFSTMDEVPGNVTFEAVSEEGSRLRWEGHFGASPLEAIGRLELDSLHIDSFQPYYRQLLNFEVNKARLDLAFDVAFTPTEAEEILRIRNGSVRTYELQLHTLDEQEQFFDLPHLTVDGFEFALAERTVAAKSIEVAGGSVRIINRAEEGLNLTTLLRINLPESPEKVATPETSGPAWSYDIGEIVLDQYLVEARDQVPSETATLDLLVERLRLAPVSSKVDQPVSIDGSYDFGGGSLKIQGQITPSPLEAQLEVEASALPSALVQPYVSDIVSIILDGGNLDFSGDLELTERPSGGGPVISLKGRSTLQSMSIVNSSTDETLVSFEELAVSGLDLLTDPMRITLDELSVNSPHAYLAISPDGQLSLPSLVAGQTVEAAADPNADAEPPNGEGAEPGSETPEPPATRGEVPEILLRRVGIAKGELDFVDRRHEPPTQLSLGEIEALVSNLTNQPGEVADLEISGVLNDQAPFKTSGQVDITSVNRRLHLDIVLDSADLSPFTGYSEQVLGRKLNRGKLQLDVDYTIDEGKLEASNHVIIQGFELGEPVESPNAINAPIGLAVSLLKNRDGSIDLQVPVSGDVNDPEFSYGGIVAKAFLRLILKAATSPFALIGSMFGGGSGEELQKIELPPGSAQPEGEAQSQIEVLATALYERPQLTLGIAGSYHPETDRRALKERRLGELLESARLEIKEIRSSQNNVQPSVEAALVSGLGASSMRAEPEPSRPELLEFLYIQRVLNKSAENPGENEEPDSASSDAGDLPESSSAETTVGVEVDRTEGSGINPFRWIGRLFDGDDEEQEPEPRESPDREPAETTTEVTGPAPVPGPGLPSSEEIEAAVLDTIEVSDEELQALGRDRAIAAQKAILAAQEIDPESTFIENPSEEEAGVAAVFFHLR